MGPSRLHRGALVVLMLALLGSVFFSQRDLNRSRVALGITRGEGLGRTAPPVLVFTTVALGGLRGLIANALWVRAMELQDEGKYFEKVQLADWITKLQPHFVHVWVVQAWDMAYNISVKFDNPRDRWLWVQRGIELLRDEGLRYNPDETALYRELGWLFQHKIGQDMDDAHRYYKSEWAREMDQVLGGTNYTALIHPQTEDEKRRAQVLREKYKLDPQVMKEIDDEYGPLEWRLPEAHAVYWATMGFKRAKQKDFITLRREIYQPLQLAFQRGRLIEFATPEGKAYSFGPNLEMIPKTNLGYEKMMAEDPENRSHIGVAHRNFLKDAIFFLYTYNRREEAARWFEYLLKQYPDAVVEDERKPGKPTVRVADLSLDDFAVARVTEVAGETSNTKTTEAVEGLLVRSYYNLATGQDEPALNYELMAKKVWNQFQQKTASEKQQVRVGLAPFDRIKQAALDLFENQYGPLLTARLRSRLGLPPATAAPEPATPTPAPPPATNAPGPVSRPPA
jgi:hypothetical protein